MCPAMQHCIYNQQLITKDDMGLFAFYLVWRTLHTVQQADSSF